MDKSPRQSLILNSAADEGLAAEPELTHVGKRVSAQVGFPPGHLPVGFRSHVAAGLGQRCSPVLPLSMLLVRESRRARQLVSQGLVSPSAKPGHYRLTDGVESSQSCCSNGKRGSPL